MLPGCTEACLQAPGKSEGGQADGDGVLRIIHSLYSILATEQWKKQMRTREAKGGLWELVSSGDHDSAFRGFLQDISPGFSLHLECFIKTHPQAW